VLSDLLAIPMMLELVMESIFAAADIWFVTKHYEEKGVAPEAAVAAVGLTEAVVTLLAVVSIAVFRRGKWKHKEG